MADLTYGTNPGCVVRHGGGAGPPRQCGGAEAAAVPHQYLYPRRRTARVYVCEDHALQQSAAEPLTASDRAEIARRYRRREQQLARVTVGPYARPGAGQP